MSLIDFASGVTTAVYLNQASKHIEKASKHAKGASRNIYNSSLNGVEILRLATLLIENMRTSYQASLQLTIDKVDASCKKNLLLLAKVLSVVPQATEDLKEVSRNLTTAVDAFEYSSLQVRDVSPHIVVVASNTERIALSVFGRFPAIESKQFSLVVGGQTVPAVATMTSRLQFSIPKQAFETRDATKITCFAAKVLIAEKHGWFFDKKREFLLLVPVVSPCCGEFSLQLTRKIISQQVTAGPAKEGNQGIHSKKHTKHLTQVFTASPSPGWQIQPSTHQFHVLRQQGRNSWKVIEDAPHVVRYQVESTANKSSKDANIHFKITFQQYQESSTESVEEETFSLPWGKSESKNIENATWKLSFSGFDGSRTTFTQPDTPHPFLSISQEGPLLNIATERAEALDLETLPQEHKEIEPLLAKL